MPIERYSFVVNVDDPNAFYAFTTPGNYTGIYIALPVGAPVMQGREFAFVRTIGTYSNATYEIPKPTEVWFKKIGPTDKLPGNPTSVRLNSDTLSVPDATNKLRNAEVVIFYAP